MPTTHWEMTIRKEDMPKDAFSPKRSCDRPSMHVKINKEDH